MTDIKSELPKGWIAAAVDEIAQTATGGTPSRKRDAYYRGEIPWVKSGDLNDGLITETRESITDEGLDNSNAKMFPRGAVCVALYGATVGKLGILEIDATTNQAVCGIFPEGGIGSKFVFYSLRNERQKLISQAQGGAQPNISNGIIKKTVLRIPPLAEQRRIVGKIETLQERSRNAREALEEVGPLLEQFRQSLLAAAFRGDLTADWRAANPNVELATELLNRIRQERRERWEQAELAKYETKGKQPPKGWQDKYKEPEPVDDSESPELPDGWCWSDLEFVMDDQNSFCYGVVQPGFDDPVGAYLIRAGDLENGTINQRELRRIPVDIHNNYLRSQVSGGEILVTVVGANIGVSAIVPDSCRGFNIARALAKVPIADFDTQFVRLWLTSSYAFTWMKMQAREVARPTLNLEQLKRLPIPIPPVTEQREIVRRVLEMLEAKSRMRCDVSKSESAFSQLEQSILAKAFRGELVPQDPNDEPASVLLERIREQRSAQVAAKKNVKVPTRRRSKKKEKA